MGEPGPQGVQGIPGPAGPGANVNTRIDSFSFSSGAAEHLKINLTGLATTLRQGSFAMSANALVCTAPNADFWFPSYTGNIVCSRNASPTLPTAVHLALQWRFSDTNEAASPPSNVRVEFDSFQTMVSVSLSSYVAVANGRPAYLEFTRTLLDGPDLAFGVILEGTAYYTYSLALE